MTKHTEIPADIREKAESIVVAICGDTSMTLMGDVENMVDPIAEAIMQERERCAKLVLTIRDDQGFPSAEAEEIATAIRHPIKTEGAE